MLSIKYVSPLQEILDKDFSKEVKHKIILTKEERVPQHLIYQSKIQIIIWGIHSKYEIHHVP